MAWLRSPGAALFAGVALTAALAYRLTLAPGLTWANGGADGGDLAAAVATLGIPHPPGYPTYVLLGRVWCTLPLGGDIAYRLNLLSAVAAALASGLTSVIAWRLASQATAAPATGSRALPAVGAAAGSWLMAFSPLLWSQATVTEVYAPGLLVFSTLAALRLGARRLTRARAVTAAALTGLGLGVLPQLAVAAPVGFAWVLLSPLDGAVGGGLGQTSAGGRCRLAVACLLAGCLGLAVFAYLPLRAAASPTANWGDPSTPMRFWDVVSAAQYRPLLAPLTPSLLLGRVGESLLLLAGQLTPTGTALALLGALDLWRRSRCELLGIAALAAATIAFRALYPAEGNEVYLLPALCLLAILAGVGAAWLLAICHALDRAWNGVGRQPPGLGPGATMAATAGLVLLVLVRVWTVAPEVDLSADRAAERFGRETLAAAPPDALVVSQRDALTFSLWYRQALGDRPDVVVVDGRLLPYTWYRDNLTRRYPDLDPAALRPGGITALGRPVVEIDPAPELQGKR